MSKKDEVEFEDFDSLFETVEDKLEEEKVETKDTKEKKKAVKELEKEEPIIVESDQELIEGKTNAEYKNTSECMSCGLYKNNISGGTGSCYECDHVPAKISKDDAVEITKAVKEMEGEAIVIDTSEKTEEERKDIDDMFADISGIEAKEDKPKKKKKAEEPDDFFADFDTKTEEKIVEKPKKAKKPKETVNKKEPTKKKPAQTKADEFFAVKEEKTTGRIKIDLNGMEATKKEVWMYSALKGKGKTTLALSHPGKIAVISFDFKSALIKDCMYDNDERIKVFDIMQYIDWESAESKLKTSETVLEFIFDLIDALRKDGSFDWILVDGSEIFQKLCEMVMRYRNNIPPYAGVQMNLWKERRQYIQNLHYKSLGAAKKGIIYTTYPIWDEKVEEGTTLYKRQIPKWIDVIQTETDIVVSLESRKGGEDFIFEATIDSSKYKKVKTGITVDVTGNDGYNKILEASK